jgi:hypothetical protein
MTLPLPKSTRMSFSGGNAALNGSFVVTEQLLLVGGHQTQEIEHPLFFSNVVMTHFKQAFVQFTGLVRCIRVYAVIFDPIPFALRGFAVWNRV